METIVAERPCTRLIVTYNSLWVLDFMNMEFQRHPRNKNSRDIAHVAYDQTDWTPFLSYEQYSYAEDGVLAGRVRFTVILSQEPGDFITSNYDPKEQ